MIGPAARVKPLASEVVKKPRRFKAREGNKLSNSGVGLFMMGLFIVLAGLIINWLA
jgi:hypothetical protein